MYELLGKLYFNMISELMIKRRLGSKLLPLKMSLRWVYQELDRECISG